MHHFGATVCRISIHRTPNDGLCCSVTPQWLIVVDMLTITTLYGDIIMQMLCEQLVVLPPACQKYQLTGVWKCATDAPRWNLSLCPPFHHLVSLCHAIFVE